MASAREKRRRQLLLTVITELSTDDLIESNIFGNSSMFDEGNQTGKAAFDGLVVLHSIDGNLGLLESNKEPSRGSDEMNYSRYVEEKIPQYSPDEFKKHFRMSRNTAEKLMILVGNQLKTIKCNIKVTIEKRVLSCIWLLATPDSYRSVADRFGMSTGNTHFLFLEFCEILNLNAKEFIKFPDCTKASVSMDEVEKRYGFPGVIGAVDGCHIAIKEPTSNKESYYNRKSYTSILLQGTCNEQLMFIDAYVGWPGSVHDARVWRNSPLFQKLRDGRLEIPSNSHLIGDSAYPLDSFLLTPYKDNGHLSPVKKKFNTKLSSARSMIERAFALLKQKWRRLKYLDMSLINVITKVIVTCCVLHNFILLQDVDSLNGLDFSDDELDMPAEHETRLAINDNVNSQAVCKRDEIALRLNFA